MIIGYYNILITDATKKVCTITTTFGKYKYNRLPMRFCIAPDVFQEEMRALMGKLEFVRVYPGDFLIVILVSFEEKLAKVEEVMNQLGLAGLKCKIDKYKFAVPKVEYFVYIITR